MTTLTAPADTDPRVLRDQALIAETREAMHRLRAINVEARTRLRRLSWEDPLHIRDPEEREAVEALVADTDVAAGIARRSLAPGDFVWVALCGTGVIVGPDPDHETRLLVLLDDPGEGPGITSTGRENMYFMGTEPIPDDDEEWTRAYDAYVPAH